MENYQIVTPDIRYKNSYVDALKEGFRSIAPPPERIAWIENNFHDFLREEQDLSSRPEWWQKSSAPVTLADGTIVKRVPCTSLWLVVGDRFIGEVAIRHRLTPELEKIGGHIGYNVRLAERKKGYGTILLQTGLEEARKIGLDTVLLTCNDDNTGSIKIIESAGAELKDTLDIAGRPVSHRRYIIRIK